MKSRLKAFINHPRTDLFIGILILISVGVTLLEVQTADGTELNQLFGWIGWIINILFCIELAIRWYSAGSTRHFLRQYWMDILAVIPVVKAFRVLRLLRLLRLVRLGILVTRRARNMAASINEALAENVLVVVILVMVFLIGAVGIFMVEGRETIQTFGDAVWWSLFSLMAGEPIGGEPATFAGRIILMIVMLGGFTTFALFTGVVSAVMVARLRGGMEAKDVELENLTGHYVICGWNRTGPTIVFELQANAKTRETPIVIVAECDAHPELPGVGINRGLVFFIRADFTSTEALRKARVEHAQKAIILADKSKARYDQDRDARTILAALTIEKMNKDARARRQDAPCIYSFCEMLNRDEQKVRVLEESDVEDIVEGDEYVGNLIAHSIRAFGLIQVLNELLTSTRGNEFDREPVTESLAGLRFVDALEKLKRDQDTLILAVSGDRDEAVSANSSLRMACVVNPDSDRILELGDELIVIRHPGDRATGQLSQKNLFGNQCSRALEQTAPPQTLAELKNHCIICGWTRAVPKIFRQLRQAPQTQNVPIVFICERPDLPDDLQQDVDAGRSFFIPDDYTSTGVLEKARVGQARTAILVADNSKSRSDQDRDARSILAALTIEKINPNIHTCVELLNRNDEKVQVLRMAHVEDIVVGDEYLGNLIAHATHVLGLARVLDELLTANMGNEFHKIQSPKAFTGESFSAALAQYKRLHAGIILAVETQNRPAHLLVDNNPARDQNTLYYLVNPPPEYILQESDNLFVVSETIDQPEVLD